MRNNGRKPAHLCMLDGKDNRQRIWDVLRQYPAGISGYAISRRTNIADETVKTYISCLRKGGFLERCGGVGELAAFRLVRDTGAEAPRLRLDGTPSLQGRGTEAMWRTLRILDSVNASELATNASAASATSLATAKNYLKWLNWGGYLDLVTPSQPGRQARYRLKRSMYTGPQAPMIQRSAQLYDPNVGKVVFVLRPPHDK
ncbi:hypothetical protein [Pseudomonas cavernae]|uniref:hypothetical protein n=1 Tax=Pseudomonas cavernae TaxID=2320867 RepID=UPI0013C4F420|nr:hypothetical protein [Pseudomonas cavernae]